MKTDQNIIAVIISIAALVMWYMFLWRISELESVVEILTKSDEVVDVTSLQNYLDRNVEVFSVLTTTLFAILAIVLGFIGYQWITTTIEDHKKSVVDMIAFMNKRNDEISERNEKKFNDIIGKQSKTFNNNIDQFLNSLFELYSNQALLYLRNGMPELHLDSNVSAADVLLQHPQSENLNTFLMQILSSVHLMVQNQTQLHPIQKNRIITTLTNMLSKTTNQDEIKTLSMLLSAIEALPLVQV